MNTHSLSKEQAPLHQTHGVKFGLGLLICCLLFQVALEAADPLPPHSVSRGKNLSLDVIKTVLGEAVDTASAYYFDYSNASFQIEDHCWREGLGIRYANAVNQRYRSIDFLSPSRRTYQTETLIRNDDNTVTTYPVSNASFSDWESASRHWKTYRREHGNLILEKTWVMRYSLRVKNTYYKAASFASKQLRDPLTTKVRLQLQGLPSKTINGVDTQRARSTMRAVGFATSKNGTSSSYTLPVNTMVQSQSVDELYCPGKN